MTLRFTLVSDGSSDRALLPILRWLLVEHHRLPQAVEAQWADLRRLPLPPRRLEERLIRSVEIYPCDLLFVHRDAEGESAKARREEISRALRQARIAEPAVAVVPVRMLEAWLLFDESALRQAAGNPNGRSRLALPPPDGVEAVPDPKIILRQALQEASGLGGRRRRRLGLSQRSYRISQLIEDFSPLFSLPAFASLSEDLRRVLIQHRWLEESEER